MRISKSLLVDPASNTLFGVAALTVSYFVFAYSTLFGKLPILVYYGIWFPLVIVDYRKVLPNPSRLAWILAFTALALFSVFWSRAPGVTARSSVQYLSHVLCILIAARTISPRTFTLGSLAGTFIVVVYSLATGRHLYDPLDGTFSMVGAFASKNQFGLFSSLGVFFAFCSLWLYRERWTLRIAAGLVGLLCVYTLLAANSATSLISLLAALAAIVGASPLLRFAPGSRKALLVGALILFGTLAVVAVQSGAVGVVLGAFNKNTTLTGRTYLWAQGLAESRHSPMLGLGYQAYWVQGFPGPERLWETFHIPTRTGFHFHDTYIETLVETGYVGAALLSMVLLRSLFGHTRRFVSGKDVRGSQLLLGVLVLLLVRSFVEVDILTPYQVGSFLLYYAAGLLAVPQAAARSAPAGARRQPPSPAAAGLGHWPD